MAVEESVASENRQDHRGGSCLRGRAEGPGAGGWVEAVAVHVARVPAQPPHLVIEDRVDQCDAIENGYSTWAEENACSPPPDLVIERAGCSGGG